MVPVTKVRKQCGPAVIENLARLSVSVSPESVVPEPGFPFTRALRTPMSDHPSEPEAGSPEAIAVETPPQPPEEPFLDADLRQFEADDIEAGQAITKLLSTLFIYTLVAMSIVSIWTAMVTD